MEHTRAGEERGEDGDRESRCRLGRREGRIDTGNRHSSPGRDELRAHSGEIAYARGEIVDGSGIGGGVRKLVIVVVGNGGGFGDKDGGVDGVGREGGGGWRTGGGVGRGMKVLAALVLILAVAIDHNVSTLSLHGV